MDDYMVDDMAGYEGQEMYEEAEEDFDDDTGPEPREDFGWFGDENLCGE